MISPLLTRAFCTTHPVLAERATLALLRRSAGRLPPGGWWEWFPDIRRPPVPFHTSGNPPAELREFHRLNPDREDLCPLCWQSPYANGAWWPAAGEPRANLRWHACCFATWSIWTGSLRGVDLPRYLARRQGYVCAETGDPLKLVREGRRVDAYGFAEEWRTEYLPTVEVDHATPLWRVRADAGRHEWPGVLRFWGVTNLQAVTPEGHRMKTRREAGERAALRRTVSA